MIYFHNGFSTSFGKSLQVNVRSAWISHTGFLNRGPPIKLVIPLKHIWLVVTGTWIWWISIYWECHHPNWRTHIFQRGRYTTNQWLMKNCTLLCWFAPFLDKSKWSMLGIHFWRYLVPCAEGAAYRLVMFFPHWTTPCRGAKCGHLPMWGKRQRKALVGYLSGGFLKLQMDANGEIMYNLRFCQPWKCPEHMGFLYQWATGTAPR